MPRSKLQLAHGAASRLLLSPPGQHRVRVDSGIQVAHKAMSVALDPQAPLCSKRVSIRLRAACRPAPPSELVRRTGARHRRQAHRPPVRPRPLKVRNRRRIWSLAVRSRSRMESEPRRLPMNGQPSMNQEIVSVVLVRPPQRPRQTILSKQVKKPTALKEQARHTQAATAFVGLQHLQVPRGKDATAEPRNARPRRVVEILVIATQPHHRK